MAVETVTKQDNTKKMKRGTSPWAIARKKFVRNKLAMISLTYLVLIAVLSFLAPYITTADITRVNLSSMGLSPSAEHWLGTDKGGRDVFTRLLYGGRVSLTIGISCVLIVTIIGTFIGSVAGYFGGKVDSVLMRFTDFILNFPFLIFVIVLNSILFRHVDGVIVLIIVISVLSWGGIARLVRSKVLAEKENEYVLAAISIGTRPSKVIIKHLLPNILSTIIVQMTLSFASMIVAETGLSYLGFGVPQGTPSWGNMLSGAREIDVLQGMPWVWAPPGIILVLTILSINFIGEGVKDALNPKSYR